MASLKNHMKMHTLGGKPYNCDDCSTRFSVKDDMTEPFSSSLHNKLLQLASPPPSDYPGYHRLPGQLPRLQTNRPSQLDKDVFYVGEVHIVPSYYLDIILTLH